MRKIKGSARRRLPLICRGGVGILRKSNIIMARKSLVHYIAPSSISITPNANGNTDDLSVHVARGAKIKVYSPASGIEIEGPTYQQWTLAGRNRRLNLADSPYTIYARLSKTNNEDGYLAFAPKKLLGEKDNVKVWVDKYSYPTKDGLSVLYRDHGVDVRVDDPDYWYVRLGDVSVPIDGRRTVTFDTGILGTDQFNMEWNLDPDDLPLRVELGCSVGGENVGASPYVPWGTFMSVAASLVKGWGGDLSENVRLWTITRNTGNSDSDVEWSYPYDDGSSSSSSSSSSSGSEPDPRHARRMDGGSINLYHLRTGSDDFGGAVAATFAITAWGNQTPASDLPDTADFDDSSDSDSSSSSGDPVLVALATGFFTALAETVESYEIVPSVSVVSYDPAESSYSPADRVTFCVRAKAQSGATLYLSQEQIQIARLHLYWQDVDNDGDSSGENIPSELFFVGGVATLPVTVFNNQKGKNVWLENGAQVVQHETTVAYVRYGENGEDSKEREYIYIGKSTKTVFSGETLPANIPKGEIKPASIADGDDENKNQDGWVPNGWSDNAIAVDDTHNRFVYESIRIWNRTNNEWGSFSTPKLRSNWGVQGIDGDGVQYIYKLFDHELTDTERVSLAPTGPTEKNADGEWLPISGDAGWTDDPQSPTNTLPFCYCSIVKSIDGEWEKDATGHVLYGKLGLWSKWSFSSLIKGQCITTTAINPAVLESDGADGDIVLDMRTGSEHPLAVFEVDPETGDGSWNGYDVDEGDMYVCVADLHLYSWDGAVWQDLGLFSGAEGQSAFKSTVFCRTNTQPQAPRQTQGSYEEPSPSPSSPWQAEDTSGTGISGVFWSDGIPAGQQKLWASTRIFTSDGASPQQTSWSTPRQMTDTDTFDVEFAYMQPGGVQPHTPTTDNRHKDSDPYGYDDQVWFDPELDAYSDADVPRDFTEMVWRAERMTENGTEGTWVITQVKGENGESVFSVFLDAYTDDIPCDANGHPVSASAAVYSKVIAEYAGEDVTDGCQLSYTCADGDVCVTLTDSRTGSGSSMTEDTPYSMDGYHFLKFWLGDASQGYARTIPVTLNITHSVYGTRTLTFVLTCSRPGADGAGGLSLEYPDNILLQQADEPSGPGSSYTAADFGLPVTVNFVARRGDSPIPASSISVAVNTNSMGLSVTASGNGFTITGYSPVGTSYVTRGVISGTVTITEDGTVTVTHNFTIGVFVNLVGIITTTIKHDVETTVAEKLSYDEEGNTLDEIGQYIRSASERVDSVSETVNGIVNNLDDSDLWTGTTFSHIDNFYWGIEFVLDYYAPFTTISALVVDASNNDWVIDFSFYDDAKVYITGSFIRCDYGNSYHSQYFRSYGAKLKVLPTIPSNAAYVKIGIFDTEWSGSDITALLNAAKPVIETSSVVNESYVRQTANTYTINVQSTIEGKLVDTGINIHGSERSINLYADTIKFCKSKVNTQPSDEAKVSIDPDKGTLRAVDGEFSGVVDASILYKRYCRLSVTDNLSSGDLLTECGGLLPNVLVLYSGNVITNSQTQIPSSSEYYTYIVDLPPASMYIGLEMDIYVQAKLYLQKGNNYWHYPEIKVHVDDDRGFQDVMIGRNTGSWNMFTSSGWRNYYSTSQKPNWHIKILSVEYELSGGGTACDWVVLEKDTDISIESFS